MKYSAKLENDRQLKRLNKVHELADGLSRGDQFAKVNAIISDTRASILHVERCIDLDDKVPLRHITDIENSLSYLEEFFDFWYEE